MEISSGVDVANYASQRANSNVMKQVSTAMLDKSLEQEEKMGQQLTKMMEMSVNPNVGGNFDVSV